MTELLLFIVAGLATYRLSRLLILDKIFDVLDKDPKGTSFDVVR